MAPYPWQTRVWQDLVRRWQAGNLPHALLLSGQPGLGKRAFATQLTNLLLCDQPNEDQACGQCASCRLLASASHPDLHQVGLEEGSRQIKVDQIRRITQIVNVKSQLGGYKAIILDGAERLNANAANSFLKTLEEPPGATVMVLVADQPWRLPTTIRSRCQHYVFRLSAQQMAKDWLQTQVTCEHLDAALALAPGAPLQVLHLLEHDGLQHRRDFFKAVYTLAQGQSDPLVISEQWHERLDRSLMNWMISWVQDMIRIRVMNDQAQLDNPDLIKPLQQISVKVTTEQLLHYQDRLFATLRYLEGSLNSQLILDDLLIQWAMMVNESGQET